MNFPFPFRVLDGQLCDRFRLPLALNGRDFTPLSDARTDAELNRFQQEGCNLIRLKYCDETLSGMENFRQLIRLYDYAVEQIYRRGMFLWLVPITQGKNYTPEEITRQQLYLSELFNHENPFSGKTLPEYGNTVCIETLFPQDHFSDEQFNLYVTRVLHQVYIEHSFSGEIPRVCDMNHNTVSPERIRMFEEGGGKIITADYFAEQNGNPPVQCETNLPGIPASPISAHIRSATGKRWHYAATGRTTSISLEPHKNGGAEAFLSFAANDPCVVHLTFPSRVHSAKFRPSLEEKAAVAIHGNSAELTLPSPRYGVLEINYEAENAPAYTVYILADAIMPAPDLANAKWLAPGIHTEDDLLCGTADVLAFRPGLHDIAGRLFRPESGKTVWLPRGAVLRAGIRTEENENVRILGQGIIDGSRNPRDAGENKGARMGEKWIGDAGYEGCICFHKGQNLLYDGPLLYNPQFWNFVISGVQNCTVRSYKCISWIQNNDGIQPRSCQNLLVEHAFMKCNDDCVAIKTRRSFDMVSGNLLFRDLVLWNDCAGGVLQIGHTSQGDLLHDVRFENIRIIRSSNYTLGICIIDHSTVDGVSYENIYVEGCTPGHDFAFRIQPGYYTTDKERGHIRNVSVKNFFSEHLPSPGFVQGFDEEHKAENIHFENINFRTGSPKQFTTDKILFWDSRFSENITVTKGN